MKVLSRVCFLFMAFGLVGCDDPETQKRNAVAFSAAQDNAFASDIFPFATACLETIETGSLTASPLIEVGFQVTKMPNRINFQRVFLESTVSEVSISGAIKKSVCVWRVGVYGNYLGVAENVVTILKKYGYEEVSSSKRNARFFSKNGRTIKLLAAALRSQYGNVMEVFLILQ